MSSLIAASAANRNYLFPLSVMLRSLSDSCPPGSEVDFRLLTVGLEAGSLANLKRALRGTNIKLSEVVVNTRKLHGLKLDGHISIETYLRLLAPSLLTDVSKLLYLDADVIVRHPILDLYSKQFLGAALLAVPNPCRLSAYFGSPRGVPGHCHYGIAPNRPTFNAGVMLLDMAACRRLDLADRALSYLRRYREDVLWWDQHALNIVMFDQWSALPAKWNVPANHVARMKTWHDSVLNPETFNAIRRNPAIIHYSSPNKPWHTDYSGPFYEDWCAAVAKITEPVA